MGTIENGADMSVLESLLHDVLKSPSQSERAAVNAVLLPDLELVPLASRPRVATKDEFVGIRVVSIERHR